MNPLILRSTTRLHLTLLRPVVLATAVAGLLGNFGLGDHGQLLRIMAPHRSAPVLKKKMFPSLQSVFARLLSLQFRISLSLVLKGLP